jgi:hypothetical protein
LQELARRAQRRSLDSATQYFADLAADVGASLGYIPSLGTSGIVWDDSRVVSGPLAISNHAATLTVRTASGEHGATGVSSPRLPLSVLEVSHRRPARTATRAASLPHTGEWVTAVWLTDRSPAFAAGNFRQTTRRNCGMAPVRELVTNITLTREMIGGAIFDMDRELLAVLLPCGNRLAAIEPSSVDDMLKQIVAVDERVLARYGLLFARLSQDEGQYFSDADGLLVREVWSGTRGEAAGFRPGDVVVALNDDAVAEIDDLKPLTIASGTAMALRVRRGPTRVTVTLDSSAAAPGPSNETGAELGLVMEVPTATFRIDSVQSDSRAARAGVRAGDILRRINHVEPRTRAQADRAVKGATSKPTLLEIERDRRRIAIVIPKSAAR